MLQPTPIVLCGPTSSASWIEWLEHALPNHPKMQPGPVPTLHECTGGCYEVTPLRASPPMLSKGTPQALWRGLEEKFAPPFLPGLFKLARALQTSGSTHYPPVWALLLVSPNSGASSTCDHWIVLLLGWSHRNLVHLQSLICATFGLKPLYGEYSWRFCGLKSQYAR